MGGALIGRFFFEQACLEHPEKLGARLWDRRDRKSDIQHVFLLGPIGKKAVSVKQKKNVSCFV